MKTILFIIALSVLFATVSFSQNSWIRQLPDNGNPLKMIKTIDDKFALIAWGNAHYFYKYDEFGTLIWRKEIFSNCQINDFIQIDNGNYVIVGGIWVNDTANVFIGILSEFGDSLFSTYRHYSYPSLFYNIAKVTSNELWCSGGGSDSTFIFKYTLEGNYINRYFSDKIGQWLYINQDTIFTAKNMWNGNDYITTFCYLNSNLNLISEKQYRVFPEIIRRLDVNRNFLIQDAVYYSPVTGFDNNRGFVKLNINLDSVWSVPFSHIYGYGSTCYTPSDLIVSNDNQYIICGTMEFNYQQFIYLIKTDSLGNQLLLKTYQESIADNVKNIIQVSDGGFIMFQHSLQSGNKLWIVKTNADGSLSIDTNSSYSINELSLYPNPAIDVMNVNFFYISSGVLSLIDMLGNEIKKIKINDLQSVQVDVGNLKKGFYIIKFFEEGSRKTYFKKIIKQ